MLSAGKPDNRDNPNHQEQQGGLMNTIETNTGIQLIQAARHGDVNLVRNLLDQGSSAKTHDKDGWTALMRAAHLGHTEIVKILLPVSDSREYVDVIGQSEMTALDWAVAYPRGTGARMPAAMLAHHVEP